MPKNFCIVEKGLVVNVVLSETAFEDNWVQSDVAQIGWSYDGNTFAPPDEAEQIPSTKENQQANRANAFKSEADPLFFKWQAGEGTKDKWEAKREEIRQRFPYPKN